MWKEMVTVAGPQGFLQGAKNRRKKGRKDLNHPSV
jgi:hypothetical protein